MKSKAITRAVLVAAFGAALVPTISGAITTKTLTFDVTLKIIADCVIATNPLDFGQSQGVLNTAVNQTSQLQVTCTNTTPYNIGLNAGTGTGSTIAARVMSGTGANTSTVGFNLYQTAGATNWGNTSGSDTKSGIGNGTTQSLTVYGTIPVQTTPQPDTYKSTITATVYF